MSQQSNPPRSVEEWAAKCHDDYLTGMRVEGKSWGHLRHGMCVGCALLYAAEQVAQARAEERELWRLWFVDQGWDDTDFERAIEQAAAIRARRTEG